MPAVRQIQAEYRIAGVEYGGISGLVGLRARMRLDVGVFGVEQRFGALAGQDLYLIHEFATAVIALAGITFGVFIRQHAAGGFEDGFRSEILAGDQLEMGVL